MLGMRRVGFMVVLLIGMFGVSGVRANLIVNPGFETPVAIRSGLGPATGGEWRGDPAEMVTAQDGIVPPEGERMVHLIGSYPGGAIGHDTAIWQLIDLRPYKDQIAEGIAVLSARARFNRVAGDDETDTSLGFFFRTNYHQPTSFGGDLTSDTFESDGDIDTWEIYTTNFRLPNDTEFVFAGVLAVENVHDDGTSPEFDGHYVDDVSLTFHTIGPSTLTGAASGNWNAPSAWGDGTAAPTEDSETIVTQHTVTVATNGTAQSLLIDDNGAVVIGHNSNLTVVNALEINNGTLEIAAGGTVNVGADLRMKAGSDYVYQLDTTANGLTTVAGDADLDGTLIVQATGRLETLGLSTRPIIVAGRIADTFATEPAVGGHLGYGVFHQGVWYNFAAGVVREEVFQAAAGDVDGDGQINNADLQGILSANSFNNPGDWGWIQGDFDGDGLVGNDDLQMVLATGYFGDGPYVATPSWGSEGELAVVPEPQLLVLLLSGVVTLGWFRRLKQV